MTSSPSARTSAWTLVTLCAVLGLDGMDVASMGPALPQIQADLGMSATSLQWVVSAYVIGYGGFVLLGGRLADLFPRRRLLLGSLLIFSVASLIGAVADEGTIQIIARLAKGIAAAFSAPAALAILLNIYTDPPSATAPSVRSSRPARSASRAGSCSAAHSQARTGG